MSENLILKIIALIIATFFGIAKLIKYDPLREWKEDLIRDLDILSKLDENHNYYKTVKASADISLLVIYSKDHKTWYSLSHRKNQMFLAIVILLCITVTILFIVDCS